MIRFIKNYGQPWQPHYIRIAIVPQRNSRKITIPTLEVKLKKLQGDMVEYNAKLRVPILVKNLNVDAEEAYKIALFDERSYYNSLSGEERALYTKGDNLTYKNVEEMFDF